MKNLMPGLRSGDISPTSPAATRGQELAKYMILNAAKIQPSVGDALGATCAFTAWLISHLAQADQPAAVDAFVRSVQMTCKGFYTDVRPLAEIVTVVDAQGNPLK